MPTPKSSRALPPRGKNRVFDDFSAPYALRGAGVRGGKDPPRPPGLRRSRCRNVAAIVAENRETRQSLTSIRDGRDGDGGRRVCARRPALGSLSLSVSVTKKKKKGFSPEKSGQTPATVDRRGTVADRREVSQ
jgi:hypothetical protein